VLLRQRSTRGEIVTYNINGAKNQNQKATDSLFSVLAQAGNEQVDALLLQETHYYTNREHLPFIKQPNHKDGQPTSLMVANQTPPRGGYFSNSNF
jgi:exonuclease III